MAQKVEAIKSAIQGGTTSGKSFDDGGNFNGIRKVYVTHDGNAVRHIKFDYDKAGQVETRERGEKTGTVYEFAINHPHEYLTSVEVTYTLTMPYGCDVLKSFVFKTSKGRTSPLIGKPAGKKFVLESKDKVIVGFHGRVGSCVDGIGAYYNQIIKSPSIKSTLQGGTTTGKVFDDGGDFDGIRKVYVTHDGNAVRNIKFDYDKAGQVVTHERGVKTGTVYEFAIDYPNEYLTSVEVTYALTFPYGCDVLKSFVFKTSKGRTSPLIGKAAGKKFVLESKGKVIVGFHGRVGSCVDGIGAYYNV